jgi:hypothetical protein
MSDASYRILRREDQSVAVEILRSGSLPQIAAGFETEDEAAGWIEQDKRLSNAGDTFRTPAERKRRGD